MKKILFHGFICLCLSALAGMAMAGGGSAAGQAKKAGERADLVGLSLKIDKSNYSWSGKILTVKFAHGVRKYKNNLAEGENWLKHQYLGYSAEAGFHFIEAHGWEWETLILVDGESGAEVFLGGLLPGGISPDRQWVLNVSGEMGSCSGAIQMTRIPKKGMTGKPKEVSLPGKLDECRDPDPEPKSVHWLSESKVQVNWECPDEAGNTRPDQITLEWRGNAWDVDRIPCGKVASTHAQETRPPVAQAAAPNAPLLKAGMTLDEVEKIFGRSANSFLVNPIALIGKKEITRVWKVGSRQVEVDFEAGLVKAWRVR